MLPLVRVQTEMTSAAASERERTHVRDIRHADIDALRRFFPTGARVLEIGGGNGLQASVVAAWGCTVDAIDIQAPRSNEPVYYPVTMYDGRRIPFDDQTFDVVYSSFVLEHVADPVALLREVCRVLKPTGKGIHIVPGIAWRFWTMAAHYPHLVRRALTSYPLPSGAGSTVADAKTGQSRRPAWRRIVFPAAHGEYASAGAELYYYSRRRWRRVFAEAGFDVEDVRGTGLFFTGYRLLPGLSANARRHIASWLGSAGQVFTVRTQR